jgi:cysteinyl-tRNA synthetase
LNVDAEKMSKSLGNFVTIGQILERNDAEALRYFILGTHYRGPLNFDLDTRSDGRVVFPSLDEAERRVEYLYATRESLVSAAAAAHPSAAGDGAPARTVRDAPQRVLESLDGDLNTSVALSVIAEVARVGNEINQQLSHPRKGPQPREPVEQLAAATVEALDACCRPLGLMQASSDEFFARTRERRLKLRGLDARWIEDKVHERTVARAARDFQRSDGIRAELAQAGVELKDVVASGTTTWRIVI